MAVRAPAAPGTAPCPRNQGRSAPGDRHTPHLQEGGRCAGGFSRPARLPEALALQDLQLLLSPPPSIACTLGQGLQFLLSPLEVTVLNGLNLGPTDSRVRAKKELKWGLLGRNRTSPGEGPRKEPELSHRRSPACGAQAPSGPADLGSHLSGRLAGDPDRCEVSGASVQRLHCTWVLCSPSLCSAVCRNPQAGPPHDPESSPEPRSPFLLGPGAPLPLWSDGALVGL